VSHAIDEYILELSSATINKLINIRLVFKKHNSTCFYKDKMIVQRKIFIFEWNV